MTPKEARSLRKSIHDTFFMKFSSESTHAADTVGEKAHLCPGANKLDCEANNAKSK